MELFFFLHELLNCLLVKFIGNAAIDRANSGALWFLMKALALRTFIGRNVVGVGRNGRIALLCTHHTTVHERKSPFYGGTICDSPFYSALVDGIVRTFGLAGPAINTFVGNFNRHNAEKFDANLRYLRLIPLNEARKILFMKAEERIQDLENLGTRLNALLKASPDDAAAAGFSETLRKAGIQNPWFDQEMSRKALSAFLPWLRKETLEEWLQQYPLPKDHQARVGIIMAGNIPAVGFHDVLCVLASGHHAVLKFASDDSVLIPFLLDLLYQINPAWQSRVSLVEQKLPDTDALIATGSNNSSRYFEYYFRNKPSLIRKSRSSVAVLKGDENSTWLQTLGEDIFSFYGMGCRSVSKVFVPRDYDFTPFFEAIFPYSHVTANRRYLNNYEYYRAYYLMNLEPLLDNHFLLLKRDEGFASPPSVLYFETYNDLSEVKQKINLHREQIQCVVGDAALVEGALMPGTTQQPRIYDYADGVDTMAFLCSLSA